ncbi:unnamed protein product, partial [Mesorhabditis belari]|uniref:Caveolin n=1 Tax=Mesorhabditis belari TaxID=2138241 RepID=A0AAF3J1J6_9BILA
MNRSLASQLTDQLMADGTSAYRAWDWALAGASRAQMETIYQRAQEVVAQLPLIMSDDEVVQHYDEPPKEERGTLPGPKKFSQPPASQSTAARAQPDIGDRIMQEEIPLDNRDEKEINTPLNVHFLDIFAEPEPTLHSIDCLWTNSYRVFEVTRLWAYRIISLILGLPVAFCCGLSFACVSFNYIWCFHPARRIILIEYHMIKQIVYGAAGLFCRPVALAFGNIFANIRIHRSQGEKVPEEQLLIV